jgi:hypothetical protein
MCRLDKIFTAIAAIGWDEAAAVMDAAIDADDPV